MSHRPLIALLAAAFVAGLVAASTVAVVQSRRATAEAERAAELAEQVERLEQRVAALEASEASDVSPLDELLGGELSELFDGMLGGGGGDVDGLLHADLDPEELAARADVLVALRAIPAGSDLAELQRELLEGQVAGYYATEEDQLVVRTPEGTVRPLDPITLAHELDHALVDQVVGLPDLDELDTDATLARLAVVEGDATLLMHLWTLEHLSFTDQLGMLGAGDIDAQQAQLETFPHHLQRELVFPYTAGLALVCERWLAGGWDAVDATYADPPLTSAGVLFPERAGEAPAPVPALTAPDGPDERFTDTFGAAELLWLLEAPGGDTGAALDGPAARAAAWAGGEVRLWDVDGERAVGLSLAERDADDPDLCGSVTDWYGTAAPAATRTGSGRLARFSEGDEVAVIRCDADGVRLAVAPTAALADAVVGAGR
ncbi:MAG: hypothetical protein WEB09_07490 [Nitriliruptor sp.]